MKNKQEKDHLETQDQLATKWLKLLPENFYEAAQSMPLEDLKRRLVDCEKTISSTEKEMDNDAKLNELRENCKALTGGYKDLINPQKAMIKCIVHVLNDRGNS